MLASLDPLFAEAFIHRLGHHGWSRYRIFGQRLRPFSLWHELLLLSAESPLVIPGAQPLPRDLQIAAAICSTRYQEPAPPIPGQWRIAWQIAGRGFSRNLAAFREYLADFQSPPRYTIVPSKNAASAPAGILRGRPPQLLSLIVNVISITGCSRREAWEMPQGEALWWDAMAKMRQGMELDFDSPEKLVFREQIKAEDPALYEAMRRAAEQFATGAVDVDPNHETPENPQAPQAPPPQPHHC